MFARYLAHLFTMRVHTYALLARSRPLECFTMAASSNIAVLYIHNFIAAHICIHSFHSFNLPHIRRVTHSHILLVSSHGAISMNIRVHYSMYEHIERERERAHKVHICKQIAWAVQQNGLASLYAQSIRVQWPLVSKCSCVHVHGIVLRCADVRTSIVIERVGSKLLTAPLDSLTPSPCHSEQCLLNAEFRAAFIVLVRVSC